MPIATTSKYSQENTPITVRLYDTNRYRRSEPERRGFLKNEQPQNTGTTTDTVIRRNATAVFGQNRTVKKDNNPSTRAIAQQRGITAYRRNNETPGRNAQGAQPGALFSLTKSALGTTQQTSAAAGTRQTTTTLKKPAVTSTLNNAIKTYLNLSNGVSNTSDLISRGADVYKKTRHLNPMSLKSIQSGQEKKSNTTIAIPPTITSLFSRGLTEYILNSGADNTANDVDLFLKVGTKRMIESQLFI